MGCSAAGSGARVACYAVALSACFLYILTLLDTQELFDNASGLLLSFSVSRFDPVSPMKRSNMMVDAEMSHITKDVDCARIFRNDRKYIRRFKWKRRALEKEDGEHLDMSCEAIRQRVLPPRNKNNGFPIAFAKVVYRDYAFLEEQLAITYTDENWFCFAIDEKAPEWFYKRIVKLSNCLPNILLAKKRWPTDSAGHYQNHAHWDCLQQLQAVQWNYVILLQNHDVFLKTNDEVANILRTLNGANDILITPCPKPVCRWSLKKKLGTLKLCPKNLNDTEAAACRKRKLTWGKGTVQVSLARKTVDYMLDQLDLTPLMDELNKVDYGGDEVVMQTIAVTPEIRLPGGFHSGCFPNSTRYITRHTTWFPGEVKCRTKKIRHSVCVYGVEDLHELATIPSLTANKFMPTFDYAAIRCISELLRNRTLGLTKSKIDNKYYENLQLVKYNKHHTNNPDMLYCD